MTDLNGTSLDSRIRAEYSAVRAWIALHPYITIVLMIVAGWALGRMHIPL